MKLVPFLTPDTKIYTKGIKDLNLRPETVKLVGENIEEKLYDIRFSNDFMDMASKVQKSTNINKWNCLALFRLQ